MAKEITCGLYILSMNDKLLICHPTGSKGEWTIPKGKQEEGETPIESAVRETLEETGIKINYDFFTFPLSLPDRLYKSGRKILKSFVISWNDRTEDIEDFELSCMSMVKRDYPEIDGYKWVSIDEARKMLHESQVENLNIVENILGVSK